MEALKHDNFLGTYRRQLAFDSSPRATRNNAPISLDLVTKLYRDGIGPASLVEIHVTVGKGKPRIFLPSQLETAIAEYNRLSGWKQS